MVSQAPQALPQPAQIGTGYAVLEEIGRGGMAVVYRVRDTGRGAELALKQLLVRFDGERRRKVEALFEREFYVLSQLSHPSVVQVYDFGRDATGPFYTMELLDGGDLAQLAPLPFRSCCELMLQVCSALSLLHSRGFIHRDLSPRNVRCTRDSRAKLIDFGAMIPMGPSRQVVGTPAYIAPEALHGVALDARSDVFSLGATLYYSLTGRAPFAARSFDDLQDAWHHPPAPPSRYAPDVPAELDSLVLALLRIDPAQRPRSSFEIMQRLAAIAGIKQIEAADISQAYLQTPTLVGRDAELETFRACSRRALEGHGGGVWLEGSIGAGRSRFLDACVLEAKTQGLLVARAEGGISALRHFGSAHELLTQLVAALPGVSGRCARAAGVFERLFEPEQAADTRPQLLSLDQLSNEREKLPRLLTQFIEHVCKESPLLIAVDDAERVDEPTLALLAALAHGAPGSKLLVAVAVVSPVVSGAPPALDVLAKHCTRITLHALTADQTVSLFSSVFGPVPHVALVSDRIHAIAIGNPRVAMSVAQHMVDNQLISYVDSRWLLPPELTLTELPADAEHLLRARLDQLAPLARHLAELQALSVEASLSRADYAELAGRDSAARIDGALNALVRLGVLSSDGTAYTLCHLGDRALLLADLAEERAAALHMRLAEHFIVTQPTGDADIHHLLLGGATERALDRLRTLIAELPERGDPFATFGMYRKDAAATLEQAHKIAAITRPAHDRTEIARILTMLSVIADNKLHKRYGPAWLHQLEQDSGLSDHRALPAELEPAERLQQALTAAVARYDATPELERVYRVDEAIRYLARYVTLSIAIGARTRNARLLSEISGMLEPFAPLSPLLYALWQNALSAHEMNCSGLIERARERALHVYERLAQARGDEVQFAEAIRTAIASALAFIDSGVGLASAAHWIAAIENDPLQCVNAAYLRRFWALIEGDNERAEHFRLRAEVLALQANARQMFMPPLRLELLAQVRRRDLAGLKQVVDEIGHLAGAEPGWIAPHQIAIGHYERMRGDLPAAQSAFERALERAASLLDPVAIDMLSWAAAAAGCVGVLAARGQAAQACEFGRSALQRCELAGIRLITNDLVRELALAESKLGEHQSASQRIDALTRGREHVVEAHRIVDYEAAARIARAAHDEATLSHYLDRLAANGRSDAEPELLTESAPAAEPVASANVQVTQVTARTTLHRRSQIRSKVTSALAEAPDAAGVAQRALALLCEVSGSRGGQLYLTQPGKQLQLAASQTIEPDAELEVDVRDYWLQLSAADANADELTVEFTHTRAGEVANDVWQRADTTRYRPVVLRANSSTDQPRVGLAMLAVTEGHALKAQVWELAAALAAHLLARAPGTGTRGQH